jgi:hypothetical protein
MPSDGTRDYEVGYGKPPIGSRFKKGNNANPHGRPRKSKDLAALLKRALDMPVVVVENGARRKRTKREVVIAQLVEKCAEADLRATKILLDLLYKLERGTAAAAAALSDPGEELYEQLQARLARLAQAQAAGLPGADPSESREHDDLTEPAIPPRDD